MLDCFGAKKLSSLLHHLKSEFIRIVPRCFLFQAHYLQTKILFHVVTECCPGSISIIAAVVNFAQEIFFSRGPITPGYHKFLRIAKTIVQEDLLVTVIVCQFEEVVVQLRYVEFPVRLLNFIFISQRATS